MQQQNQLPILNNIDRDWMFSRIASILPLWICSRDIGKAH